jgi:hypothetical protein
MGRPQQTEPDDTHDPDPDTIRDPRGLLYGGDVRALQRADELRFCYRDGHGHIDARLTTAAFCPPRIFTTLEQRLFPDGDGPDRCRRIEVDAAVAGFDTARRWNEHLPGAAASVTVHLAQLDEVWRTIATSLRTGDILRLVWRADTTIPAVDGLYRDELRVEVRRGRRRFVYLLAVVVRTDGAARMIGYDEADR